MVASKDQKTPETKYQNQYAHTHAAATRQEGCSLLGMVVKDLNNGDIMGYLGNAFTF